MSEGPSITIDMKKLTDSIYEWRTNIYKEYPGVVHQYMRDVMKNSEKVMANRGWEKRAGGLKGSLSMKITKRKVTLYTRSYHGFMRQFGRTINGKTVIRPVVKKKLFMNNTGISTEAFVKTSWVERENRWTYGIDYAFFDKVDIRSNPFVADGDALRAADNKSSSYRNDVTSFIKASEEAYIERTGKLGELKS